MIASLTLLHENSNNKIRQRDWITMQAKNRAYEEKVSMKLIKSERLRGSYAE